MSQEHQKLRYNRIPFHIASGEKVLQDVEAHWEKMRATETVPAHAQVSPEALDTALAHCFVLEKVAPTIARFRVAGKNINDLLGVDVRGMPLSTLFSASGRAALEPLIASVCEGPEIAEIPVSTPIRGLRRSLVRGRLLLLPLKDRDGQVTRIFGAIVLDGSTQRHTVRFDFDQSVPLRCKRLTPMIRTISKVRPTSPEIGVAPEETTMNRAMEDLPLRRPRPYLQLVVDNT